jgi:tetratricopeptide (TPR) repeat protein
MREAAMKASERTKIALLALGATLALAASVARAADIDYDPRRAAELRRCDEPQQHGREAAARACFQPLLNSSNPLVRAEAAFALGDLSAANDLFRAAVAANDRDTRARVRWGRMFLAAGQYGDAVKLFQEALQIDPQDTSAQLAMARVAVERFDGDVSEEIAALLKADPDLLEAHLIAARLAVERGRYDDAVREAQRAEALAAQQKLPPLEALALLAAVEEMRERDPSGPIGEALAYNPHYGEMFVLLGYYDVIRRLYQQADTWLQRAVQVEPGLPAAQRELGLNLMRLGRLDEARPHLVKAYEGDPYSAATANTLKLLDSLGKFDTIHVADPQLNLQLRKDEIPTLGPYVQQLADRALPTLARKYGYTPSGPVTVEIYPDHDDFAVRTAGLPGIGLLGVTFGNLVIMDSPSGRPRGEFHWGSTLWHELTHVFTLGVTQNRVPRWFSEGLSVYEEWTSGPTPGVNMTPDVIDAFIAGQFLPVAQLDEGFIRPTYENQVQVSYQQAGLICLFAAQHWNFDRVVAMLRAFDGKTDTAAAIRKVLEITPEEFDKQFDAFIRQRYAAYIADPKRWPDLMERAHRMADAHNWSAARDAAHAAIEMLPEFTGSGSAYEVLATVEEGDGNQTAAIAALTAWRKAGGWNPDSLRKLASLLLAAQREDEAAEVLAAVNFADPLTTQGHDRLGQLLLAENKGGDALREYQVLLSLQPGDTAIANFGLARSYRMLGDVGQARRHLLESLEIAPNYRPAQHLLLEMTGEKAP